MSAKRQQHLNDELTDSLAACATKHPSIAKALECLTNNLKHHVEYTCARMLGPAAEDMPRKSPANKHPKTPVAVSPTDGTPRKRGRPRKDATPAEDNDDEPVAKRPRGRPRKSPVDKIDNRPVSPKSPVDKIKKRLVSPKSPGDKTPKTTVVASPATQSTPRGPGRPRKNATPAEDDDDEPVAKRPAGKPRKSPVDKTKTSASGGKKKSSKSKADLETDRKINQEVSNTAKKFAEWNKNFGKHFGF